MNTRRDFLTSTPLGVAALASLFNRDAQASPGLAGFPNFPAKAKRVIYLHQSGGPSQLDLFDYKPELMKHTGLDLPASIRMGQRITGMTSGQSTLPVTPACSASNNTASPAHGSANCCRIPPRSWMTSPL
jgi:hypothetical protein